MVAGSSGRFGVFLWIRVKRAIPLYPPLQRGAKPGMQRAVDFGRCGLQSAWALLLFRLHSLLLLGRRDQTSTVTPPDKTADFVTDRLEPINGVAG